MTDIHILQQVWILQQRSIKKYNFKGLLYSSPFHYYMSKFLFFTFFIAFWNLCYSQDNDNTLNIIFVGTQYRANPLYLKKIPDVITVRDRNIQEQPDKHLSGISLVWGYERKLPSSLYFAITYSVRYRLLYQTIPFNNQSTSSFQQKTKKSLISDIYAEFGKIIEFRKSKLSTSLGIGLCGLGTGYPLTQRYMNSNNESYYITTSENFIYPTTTVGTTWQKKKLSSFLRIGYCLKNPTFFATEFIFLELGAKYNILNF